MKDKLSAVQNEVVKYMTENKNAEVFYLPKHVFYKELCSIRHPHDGGMTGHYISGATVKALARKGILVRKNKDPWVEIYELAV